MRVVSVTQDGPADKAGLKANDFITAIDGVDITSMADLTSELDKHAEGDTVTLTVVRYNGIEEFLNYYGYSSGASSSNDSSYGNYYGGYFGNYPYGGYYGGRGNNNSSNYTGSMT